MPSKDFDDVKLKDLIVHATDETRVILPGTQALLGFQFSTFFAIGFEKISDTLKYLHLGSLAFVALSTAVLMSVAAYHQITENGQDSMAVHRYIRSMILLGMVLLAIGLSGDLAVVVAIVAKDLEIGIIAGVLSLIVFLMLWFAFPWMRKKGKTD